MADIRKLHNEFKDAVKESEDIINEFIDIAKSKKPLPLILLSLQKMWKKFLEFDLQMMSLYRKVIELSIELEKKTKIGTGTVEQIMYVHNFKRFAMRMHEEHHDFNKHSMEKLSGIDNVVVGLQIINAENFFKPIDI